MSMLQKDFQYHHVGLYFRFFGFKILKLNKPSAPHPR